VAGVSDEVPKERLLVADRAAWQARSHPGHACGSTDAPMLVLSQEQYEEALQRYTVGEDCPVFSGLYEYCTKYSGGSIGGAVKLNWGSADIAINWAGGLHHGKKSEVGVVRWNHV